MSAADLTVPEIDVDENALVAASADGVAQAKKMRDEAAGVVSSWSGLSRVFTMDGTEHINEVLDVLEPAGDDLVSAAVAADTALNDFAATVRTLKISRLWLLDRISALARTEAAEAAQAAETAQATASGTAPAALPSYLSLVSPEDAIRTEIRRLAVKFENAQQDAADALGRIDFGAGAELRAGHSSDGLGSGLAEAAPVWASQVGRFEARLNAGALRTLTLLSTMSEQRMEAWLHSHPDFLDLLEDSPPDPALVVEWWAGLTGPGGERSAAQVALIAAVPAVIGNLGGVPYAARNSANRNSLATELERLESIQKEGLALVQTGGGVQWARLMAENGFTTDSFHTALESATSVDKALMASSGVLKSPQLVQFHLGPPALAAISIGDMDTAALVTVLVPGMNTTVADSMPEWTEAARNLAQEQVYVNQGAAGSEMAVVAWVGYQTPTMVDVLSSDRAEAGARRLSGFTEAVTASRGWQPGENLSIVAHSYGTTTSALATATTPVENLTMLGSAGLDLSGATVDDLHVDPDRVWASEASADRIANLGRGVVDSHSGSDIGLLTSEHPVNPTEEEFGAQVFSSEESYVGFQKLEAADGHSAVPRVTANLDEGQDGDYGYLDKGTTSLRNTALTSTGLGDAVRSQPHTQEDIKSLWQIFLESQTHGYGSY